MNPQRELAIIAVILIALPAYIALLSMGAYVGKVMAIRLLFNRRNDSNGEEKNQEEI